MSTRRSDFSRDRRRRMRLGHESLGLTEGAARPRRRTRRKASEASATGPRYFAHDVSDRGLRLIDLVPRRPLTVALIGTIGWLVVLVLHLVVAQTGTPADGPLSPWEGGAGGISTASTDPNAGWGEPPSSGPWAAPFGQAAPSTAWANDDPSSGTLPRWSVWWASSCCLVAAAVAGVIFSLRRLRVDDYRGRYRLWVWMAGLAMFASFEVTTGAVAGLVTTLARHATASPDAVTLMGLPLDAYGPTLLLIVGLVAAGRATVEVHRSTPALVGVVIALTTAVAGWAVQVTLLGGWLTPGIAEQLRVAALTVPSWSTLFALILYARQVLRECLGPEFDPIARVRQEQLHADLDTVLLVEADDEELPRSGAWSRRLGLRRGEADRPGREGSAAAPKPPSPSPVGRRPALEDEDGDRDDDRAPAPRGPLASRIGGGASQASGGSIPRAGGPIPANRPVGDRAAGSPSSASSAGGDEQTSEPKSRRGWFGLGRKAKPSADAAEPKGAKTTNPPGGRPATEVRDSVRPGSSSEREKSRGTAEVQDPTTDAGTGDGARKGWFSMFRGGKKADTRVDAAEGTPPAPKTARPGADQGRPVPAGPNDRRSGLSTDGPEDDDDDRGGKKDRRRRR